MSNRNKVLVVSSKDDLHADYIIDKCNSYGKGRSIIRLNTEDFLSNCKVSFNGERFKIKIKDSEKEFFDSEIFSVWIRRPKPIKASGIDDTGVLGFMIDQGESFLNGLYYCLSEESLWINPLNSLQRAKYKIPQLILARKVGFNVPNTLITNRSDLAKNFFEEQQEICTKSLNRPNYYFKDEFRKFYTQKVDKETFYKNINSIKVCPTFFEQYIEKAFDIRVVIVGDKVFAFKIDSQSDPDSKIDFRGADATKIEHSPYKLPRDIEEKIMAFIKASNLVYSSMDLVLSKENKYYFIENNCNGQWLWLEYLTGVNISDSLIQLLFGNM